MVVDTSALMAILLGEPEADACAAILQSEESLMISAATVAEALIVAERRALGEEMVRIIDELGFEVVPTSHGAARRVALAYARWGKGVHAAGLNFGDCFAYELAQAQQCPLLFVGDDFARTDVARAL
jgi:ribonuclease VapC